MRNARPIFTRCIACFRRDEQGTQFVEVALVIPILLVLLAATAEFGRYFYYYSTLSKATRTAVRYVTSRPFTPDVKTEAINLAVCGNTATCSALTPILPGLSASNFTITSTGSNVYFPETVTVQVVNYNYQPIFDLGNFASGASWASVPVSPSTTMRYMLTN